MYKWTGNHTYWNLKKNNWGTQTKTVLKIFEGICCSSFYVKEFYVIVHKKYFLIFFAILYPTSLANLVVEVGTRHSHQILLTKSTTASGSGLAPNRWLAITESNDDTDHWMHICYWASLSWTTHWTVLLVCKCTVFGKIQHPHIITYLNVYNIKTLSRNNLDITWPDTEPLRSTW